jgi:tetratricopeptide (TPR) repeat protein
MSTPFESLQSAVHHHQAGDLARAEALYRQVLADEPRNADAHHLLGLIALTRDEPQRAVEHIQTAIDCNPSAAQFHFHLGAGFTRLGRKQEAVDSHARAARLQPGSAQMHNALGTAHREAGQAAPAEAAYRQAVRIDPAYAEARNNLGNALQDQGRLEEAAAQFKAAARLRPDLAEIQFNLGNCCKEQNKIAEAIAAYRRAVALKPDLAMAQQNLGLLLQQQNELAEAVECHRAAARLMPECIDAHSALGAALQKLDQFDEARRCYYRVLELDPANVTAQYNLATAFHTQGDLREAANYYRAALAAAPHHGEAKTGLGMVCMMRGDIDGARECFGQALWDWPESPEAHFFHGNLLLTEGKMLEGWKEFEYRSRCSFGTPRSFALPRWDGSPLDGRTLLVHAEYGFGDMMQFIRYDPMVRGAARGGRVLVEVHPRIIPLFAASGYRDLVPRAATLPPFDLEVPMMSLPGIFQTTLDTIPADVPYLFADANLAAQWRARLAEYPGFKIGIHWQGNAKYAQDRQRSMPLACFAPLAAVPGVTLISLQKGPGSEQVASACESGVQVVDLTASMDNEAGAFMDTAAVIQSLDLVVTSDSAVAHLAGAMGAKVWLALSAAAEWRWLLAREDSPWYPTMRLFRQRTLGDWADVFARIADELTKMVAAGKT